LAARLGEESIEVPLYLDTPVNAIDQPNGSRSGGMEAGGSAATLSSWEGSNVALTVDS